MLPSTFNPFNERYTRFVRMVYGETEIPEYPFHYVGSGVVVHFQGEYFMLSSKHGIENTRADPSRVFVSVTLDDKRSWPVIEYSIPTLGENFANEAYDDVSFHWLDRDFANRSSFTKFDYLELSAYDTQSAGTPLFAFGFPSKENEYDPDNKTLICGLATLSGCYDGLTRDRGIHRFRSDALREIEPDGFSGGAITSLDPFHIGLHRLQGLILRGGAGSGVFHYLGQEQICDLFATCYTQLGRISGRLPLWRISGWRRNL